MNQMYIKICNFYKEDVACFSVVVKFILRNQSVWFENSNPSQCKKLFGFQIQISEHSESRLPPLLKKAV